MIAPKILYSIIPSSDSDCVVLPNSAFYKSIDDEVIMATKITSHNDGIDDILKNFKEIKTKSLKRRQTGDLKKTSQKQSAAIVEDRKVKLAKIFRLWQSLSHSLERLFSIYKTCFDRMAKNLQAVTTAH